MPYAYASVGSPAALVFTAGACPLGPDGDVIGPGDVRAQARQAVSNLAEALQGAGSALTSVLKTTIYVASSEQADLVAAWDVISAAFGEHDVPSTLPGVAVLGWPGRLVEIEAIAETIEAQWPGHTTKSSGLRLAQVEGGVDERSEPDAAPAVGLVVVRAVLWVRAEPSCGPGEQAGSTDPSEVRWG